MKDRLIYIGLPVIGVASFFSSCGGSEDADLQPTIIPLESPKVPTIEVAPTISTEQLVKEAIEQGVIDLSDETEWKDYFMEIDPQTADRLIEEARLNGQEKYLIPFDPRGTTSSIAGAGSYSEGKFVSAILAVDQLSKPIKISSPTSGFARLTEVSVRENGVLVPKERLAGIMTKGVNRDVEINIGMPASSDKLSPFKEQVGLVDSIPISSGGLFAEIQPEEMITRGLGPDAVKNNFMMTITDINQVGPPTNLERKMTLDFLLTHNGKIAFVAIPTSTK